MTFKVVITDNTGKIAEAEIFAEDMIEAAIVAEQITDTFYYIHTKHNGELECIGYGKGD